MENTDNTFYLGLCLAGGVSAGAYTAGVVDYLLEAVEDWERHRVWEDGPTHRVVIPAIGGASSGGMTGLITASLANIEHQPMRKFSGPLDAKTSSNRLYRCWVDMTEKDMFMRMLQVSDINGSIRSLLNTEFIDEIAEEAFDHKDVIPAEHPYFSPNLKVFATLTNLKGYTSAINLRSVNPESKYYHTRHNDYAAFELNAQEVIGDNGGWIPLNFAKEINTDLAKATAKATGAFPVGLSARQVERESKYLQALSWNQWTDLLPDATNGKDTTLCVDGGIINNEPFHQVKDMLNALVKLKVQHDDDPSLRKVESEAEANKPEGASRAFQHTVLMVDPFPSEAPTQQSDFLSDDLLGVTRKTFSAMLSQGRIKQEDLTTAYDEENSELYLIDPIRYPKDARGKETKVYGEKALASGFMGGFGGFIDKRFRVHDFFLGRANCEKFLRDHFFVPVDQINTIFNEGYAGLSEESKERFYVRDGKGEIKGLQIIPIYSDRTSAPYMPTFDGDKSWPSLSESEVQRFNNPLKKRLGKLIMNVGNLRFWDKALLWAGNRLLLRRGLAKYAISYILAEMHRWKLLQDQADHAAPTKNA